MVIRRFEGRKVFLAVPYLNPQMTSVFCILAGQRHCGSFYWFGILHFFCIITFGQKFLLKKNKKSPIVFLACIFECLAMVFSYFWIIKIIDDIKFKVDLIKVDILSCTFKRQGTSYFVWTFTFLHIFHNCFSVYIFLLQVVKTVILTTFEITWSFLLIVVTHARI